MNEHDVERIIQKEMERYLVYKDCPNCKVGVSFIRFYIDSDEYKGGGVRLRCLNCLKVFMEKLVELKPNNAWADDG